MQKTTYVLGMIAMIFGAMWMMSCGGADPLDEERFRYKADIASLMNGGEDTRDVDISVQTCDDGSDENIGKFVARVRITANFEVPDMQVVGYTYRLAPISGKYYESDGASPSVVTPEDAFPPELTAPLSPRTHSYNSPVVTEGESIEFEIDIWTQTDKVYYNRNFLFGLGYDEEINQERFDENGTSLGVFLVGYESDFTQFQYDLFLTLHCHDSEGNDFDIDVNPAENPIFGNYDNC